MGDKDRQGFVIKVYSLILIMLGVTGLWCYLTFNTQGIKDFVLGNIWLYYVTLVIVIGISCSLPYKYNQLKKAPFSFIMLSIYTLTHAYLIAVLILFYKVETIYQAAATTAGMFVALTAYAVYVKGDM
jgi:FtsH-binding integral membrane protein